MIEKLLIQQNYHSVSIIIDGLFGQRVPPDNGDLTNLMSTDFRVHAMYPIHTGLVRMVPFPLCIRSFMTKLSSKFLVTFPCNLVFRISIVFLLDSDPFTARKSLISTGREPPVCTGFPTSTAPPVLSARALSN